METKILVVDDDHAFRELMISHLLRKGHTVEGAENGFQALSLLRSHGPYAILVTDLMMPGINGLELLRSAKMLDSDIEVIMITASGSLEGAVAALREDGAFDYLTKPLEIMAELSIAVERALEYQDLRRERERLQIICDRESDRMRAVIASIHEPVIMAGKDGDLQFVNPAAEKYLAQCKAGAQGLDMFPDAIQSAVTIWKAFSRSDSARVTLHIPEFGASKVQLTGFYDPAGRADGWIMTIQERNYPSIKEDYSESMQTEINRAIDLQGEAVRNLAVCSRLPGKRSKNAHHAFLEAASCLKQVGQSMHRIQSALGFCSCAIVPEGSILAAGSIVDLQGFNGEGGLSGIPGVQWDIPANLSSIKADLEVIQQAVHVFWEKSSAASTVDGSISISAKEAGGWVWVDILDPTQVSEDFVKHNATRNGCDAIARLIVGRLGGQFWQLAPEGAHIAFAFPAVRRSLHMFHD